MGNDEKQDKAFYAEKEEMLKLFYFVLVCQLAFAVADPATSRQKTSDEAHRITRGKVMPQPRGVITSPNYPSDYPNRISYWWSAWTGGGLVWRVTFNDFETEQGYDVVRIYDGPSASSPLLLTASGSGLPSTVYTTQSDLYITFDSDDSETRRGFSLNYDNVQPPSNSEETRFISPNYPNNYGNLDIASYQASTSSGNRYAIRFTDFNTEAGYDTLTIYDGKGSSSPVLLVASGSKIPSTIYTSGPDFYAIFRSDDSNVARGFEGYYSVVKQADE